MTRLVTTLSQFVSIRTLTSTGDLPQDIFSIGLFFGNAENAD